MKIGIDIMGGDYAPEAVIDGIILANEHLPPHIKFVLLGDENIAKEILSERNFDINSPRLEFVHAPDVIQMGEHPAKAFSQKPNSSIAKGFRLLSSKEIDGIASAGNTGAMLVGAMLTIKGIPGIIRPSIAVSVPKINGKRTVLLDVGLNPDCKPDVLYQYGILGSIFAENVYNVENPRVGLLNIGEEEEKGNILAQSTYAAMKGTKDFNFVGNVEGKDLFSDNVDVVVCDGFVGNIVLKQTEAIYHLAQKRNIKDEYFDTFNFENYGGTPILGVNSTVIIGHGISNAVAIKNMIIHTSEVIDAKLTEKFKEAFK